MILSSLSSKLTKSKFKVPFFIVDWSNASLIALANIPVSITSIKPIKWAETEIPGRSTSLMQYSNMGPVEIAFQIKVVYKHPIFGNQFYLKQFEQLRNPVNGLIATYVTKQAKPSNPKVLFWYGTGSTIPLVYYVTKCDFENTHFNQLGYPMVTNVDMVLKLDEENVLNMAEGYARQALAVAGTGFGIYNTFLAAMGRKGAYK